MNRSARRSTPAWHRIGLAIGVFLVLFLSWRYTPLADFISGERVVAWAKSVAHVWWAPVAVVAFYTPAAFLMFPRPLITMFAALAFGPWHGFAISIFGIVVSALATYAAGRALPERTVHRLAGKRLAKTSAAVRRRGFVSVLAVSIAPVAPFPVVGIVAGALRIKRGQYILGTVLGMVPGTLAMTVFANQIEVALENPERINYWVVATVIAILLTLTFVARRWLLEVQQQA